MDWIHELVDFLKAMGIDTPAAAAGWLVAIALGAFTVWRLHVMDEKYGGYIDKLSEIIEKQDTEWRAKIHETDSIAYGIIQDTTKAMTILSERINTLQLVFFNQKSDK
jgi:hypothetical protein